ncbi:hypothetical protein A3H16_02315 [Candidatus Kaiserbacteria bacterium RIFCSPLOWO2_12_FULL_53_8]|uniref:Membrane insertase YidC/Oxa/ALB C-terminal domain-containing protein n=1 Tax=Candidatus Kaiserbacteria bacterium RIFCSPLOWO2_12_FULL_53_8 TaxID=1798529 RepID=A0A1F6FZJ5_9BACT|nr:MAG: hypothetical protein A3H16_02315 [Candidatus Kaiserbacteria bacterium RIFCSPLOWO2_12_FULL_53_8]
MSPATPPRSQKFLQFVVTFAIVYLATSFGLRYFFPEQFKNGTDAPPETIILTPLQKKVPMGRNFSVKVENRTASGIAMVDRCPDPPLIIERVLEDRLYQVELEEPVLPCSALTEIPALSSTTVDLSSWKYSAFKEPGTYRISLPPETAGAGESPSTEIRVTKPGIFISLFRAFISKPLLNGLILIASLLPVHSLGFSIIFLTVLVRLLLYFPSQHALQSQKKMQTLQPKIDEIKKKHAGDQQKITEATMALWKQEKINPFQSCLPTLIQIPILLGLFFIIRDSNHVELARHLLYPPFQTLDWTFNTVFLGFLDLAYVPFRDVNSWLPTPAHVITVLKNAWLPLIVALLQFGQMKLAFAKKKKPEKDERPLAERLDAQSMMVYMLPVMIFFIAGGMPAAVSMYWTASTVFSIGQQVVVNRKK